MKKSTAKKWIYWGIAFQIIAFLMGLAYLEEGVYFFGSIGIIFILVGIVGYIRTKNTGDFSSTIFSSNRAMVSIDARNEMLEKCNLYKEFTYSVLSTDKSIGIIDYWLSTALQYAGYKINDFKGTSPTLSPPFSKVLYEGVVKGVEIVGKRETANNNVKGAIWAGITFLLEFLFFTLIYDDIKYEAGSFFFFAIILLIIVFLIKRRVPVGSEVTISYFVEYSFPVRQISDEGMIHNVELLQLDRILYFSPENIKIHLSVGIKGGLNVHSEQIETKFQHVIEALEHAINITPTMKIAPTSSDEVFARPLFERHKEELLGIRSRFPLSYKRE